MSALTRAGSCCFIADSYSLLGGGALSVPLKQCSIIEGWLSLVRGVAMSKIATKIFMATALLLLLLPTSGILLRSLGLVAESTMSELEGRAYEHLPTMSIASIFDESFQASFDQYLSDSIPGKDRILLANAAIQRKAIEQSASVFKFEIYPTFYGSETLLDKTTNALMPMPIKQDSEYASLFSRAAELLNAFAARHRDKNVVFYYVHRQEFSRFNPAHSLISSAIDEDYANEKMLSGLNDRIASIDSRSASADEYESIFYRTDHHWRTFGAYGAYEKTIRVLMPQDLPIRPIGQIVWDSIPFFGSKSRTGLVDSVPPDFITDVSYPESNIEVEIDGDIGGLELVCHSSRYKEGVSCGGRFANRYGEYFHSDYPIVTLRNKDAASSKHLAIIGDSYTSCIERLFAEHYGVVYVIDPRHIDGSLDEILCKYPVDDILFMMAGYTLASEEFSRAMAPGAQ